MREPAALVDHERVEGVPGRDEHVLAAVNLVGLGRVRDTADSRVPQRLAVPGIKSHEVAASIAREDHVARRREHAAGSARVGQARKLVAPGGFARLVVDSRQDSSATRRHWRPSCPRAHRAARIRVGQIQDVEAVALVDIEEPGPRRVRGRRPVGHAALDG